MSSSFADSSRRCSSINLDGDIEGGRWRAGLPRDVALEPAPRARSNCDPFRARTLDFNTDLSNAHHDNDTDDMGGNSGPGMHYIPLHVPLLSLCVSMSNGALWPITSKEARAYVTARSQYNRTTV